LRATSVRSLTWKLVISYIGVIALAIVIVSLYVGFSIRQRFEVYQENTVTRQGELLANRVGRAYVEGGRNWEATQRLVTNSAALTRSDITIVDTTGQVRVSGAEGDAPRPQPPAAEITPPLHGTIVKGHQGGFLPGNRRIYASAPITANRQIIGAVYLTQSPPRLARRGSAEEFLPTVNQRIATGGLLAGVLAALIGAVLARSITRPVREITAAVEHIAEGDYAQRVPVRSHDEVGALAEACNRMAAELERDVGELRLQEQLRRDLVSNVSHDLSTPLTSIQGFTEALMDGVVENDDHRRETYQTIYTEVLRLRRLVDDLKNLAQYESGTIAIVPRPLALEPLIQEIVRVEEASAAERGVRLMTHMPAELPLVLADSDRIGQVLLNLVDNALRYTPPDGRITIAGCVTSGAVTVDVIDTGEGIAADQLPHIFERFYRVDRSRSTRTGGGGLGLAIVKAIVETHGGTVSAESVVGKGTTLRFTLPLAPEGVPAEPEQALPAHVSL